MNPSPELRQGGRIEPTSYADVRLAIQGVSRSLLNLSDNGIGISIDKPNDFHLGQRIKDIRLDIPGRSQRFNGSVAHITRTISGLVLGIRLELTTIDGYRFIADLKRFLQKEA